MAARLGVIVQAAPELSGRGEGTMRGHLGGVGRGTLNTDPCRLVRQVKEFSG
jgi:hypothetical protein